MTQPPNLVKEEKNQSAADAIIEKSNLRRQLRLRRAAIEGQQKQAWDQAIAAQLIEIVLKKQPSCLAVYWPIQSEPMLLDCFSNLHRLGISLALPIVIAKGQALKFVPWAPGQIMEKDSFGIPTPVARELEVAPDCILAPCVGFSTDNYRLGYGGGFYDRSLALHPKASSIGIAYELSRAAFTPDQYDISLDIIVTEGGTYGQPKLS